MPKVHLSTLIQHPSRRMVLVGQRDVELPCPPFIGLEIIISEFEHFQVAKVSFDIVTGEWLAEEEDTEVSDSQRTAEMGPPPETLESLEEALKEAGFSTEMVSLDDARIPPKRRHLSLVHRGEE
jgi:hypothetical protein